MLLPNRPSNAAPDRLIAPDNTMIYATAGPLLKFTLKPTDRRKTRAKERWKNYPTEPHSGAGRRKCRSLARCELAPTTESMARMLPQPFPCGFNSCAPLCIGQSCEMASASAIRAADVKREGMAMSCFLLSAAIPPNPAHRSWFDREYCIGTPTRACCRCGRKRRECRGLRIYWCHELHGHTVPKQGDIFEDGTARG